MEDRVALGHFTALITEPTALKRMTIWRLVPPARGFRNPVGTYSMELVSPWRILSTCSLRDRSRHSIQRFQSEMQP